MTNERGDGEIKQQELLPSPYHTSKFVNQILVYSFGGEHDGTAFYGRLSSNEVAHEAFGGSILGPGAWLLPALWQKQLARLESGGKRRGMYTFSYKDQCPLRLGSDLTVARPSSEWEALGTCLMILLLFVPACLGILAEVASRGRREPVR